MKILWQRRQGYITETLQQPPEKEDSPPTEEMMSIESEGEKKVLPSPTDEVPPCKLKRAGTGIFRIDKHRGTVKEKHKLRPY